MLRLLLFVLLLQSVHAFIHLLPRRAFPPHSTQLRRAEQKSSADQPQQQQQQLLEELEAEKLKLRAATLRLEAERAELELERESLAATASTSSLTASLPASASSPEPPLPRDEAVLPLLLRFRRGEGMSWMPGGWGASGGSLELRVDVRLTLNPCRARTEGVVGRAEETRACAPTHPRARLLADSSGTTEQQQRRLVDTSVVVAPDGGWCLDKGILKLFLDVATANGEEPTVAGDVDVPSGRLILQLRCWTEQEVAAYAAAADAAAADARTASAAFDGGGSTSQRVTLLERRNRAMNAEARARAKLPPGWVESSRRRREDSNGGSGSVAVPWMGGTEMTFLSSSASTAAPAGDDGDAGDGESGSSSSSSSGSSGSGGALSTKQPGRLFGLGAEYRSCGVVFVADDAASPADLLLKAF
jgi:hypothetical protein